MRTASISEAALWSNVRLVNGELFVSLPKERRHRLVMSSVLSDLMNTSTKITMYIYLLPPCASCCSHEVCCAEA